MIIYMVQLQDGTFINKSHLVCISMPLNTTNKIENAKQWRSYKTAWNFINNTDYKKMIKRDKMEVKIIEVQITYEIKELK